MHALANHIIFMAMDLTSRFTVCTLRVCSMHVVCIGVVTRASRGQRGMMTSAGRRFAAIPCERFMYVTMCKDDDREQLLPFIAMCYFIVNCHIQCVFTTTIYLRSRSPVSFLFCCNWIAIVPLTCRTKNVECGGWIKKE